MLFDLLDASVDRDDPLEAMFNSRSKDEWEKVWHVENHSRCRDKLVRHLYWACEKDIYRLSRRNGGKVEESIQKRADPTLDYPWITEEDARQVLRYKRDAKPTGSITSECCTRVGCTWEEYAEYCPSNKRLNQY